MEIVSLLLKAGADPNIVDKVCQYSCHVCELPAENNTLDIELDEHVHVHCTEGLVLSCLSLILGNQCLKSTPLE